MIFPVSLILDSRFFIYLELKSQILIQMFYFNIYIYMILK